MGESTVLCYTVSGKCCVSRFSLRGFGIRYLMLKPDATEWPWLAIPISNAIVSDRFPRGEKMNLLVPSEMLGN